MGSLEASLMHYRRTGSFREDPRVMLGTNKAIFTLFAISFISFFVIANGCLIYISPVLGKIFRSEPLSQRERDDLEYFGMWSTLFYGASAAMAWVVIDFLGRFEIFDRYSNWISRYWQSYQRVQQPIEGSN